MKDRKTSRKKMKNEKKMKESRFFSRPAMVGLNVIVLILK